MMVVMLVFAWLTSALALRAVPQQQRFVSSQHQLTSAAPPKGDNVKINKITALRTDSEALAAQWAAEGIVYLENFFSASCFKELVELSRSYSSAMRPESETSVARGRLGAYVGPHDPFAKILTSGAVRESLREIAEADLQASDFPVELRRYLVDSEMGWHSDEMLYSEPQVECVLTLMNTSDSETQWETKQGHIVSTFMKPNSLLLVRAEGPRHRVTPLTRGDRVIAKFVYTNSLYKLSAWYANLDAYDQSPSEDLNEKNDSSR